MKIGIPNYDGDSGSLVGSHLRLAAALAHTIPGVVVELACGNGDVLTVAYCRLDAQLDPCQLRTAVLAESRLGIPRLADVVVGVRVAVGLEDLGAGLYRRRGGAGDERWFAAELGHEEVCELVEHSSLDISRAMDVSARPDIELGITVVRIAASHPSFEKHLDSVGFWALGAVMVAELVAASAGRVHQ